MRPMAVYKRFDGKKLKDSRDPNWNRARWWVRKKVGGILINKSLPFCRTRDEAEQAERDEVRRLFDRRYGNDGPTIRFDQFTKTYLRYVETANRNVAAKRQYVRLLTEYFGSRTLDSISPQDCRDCQTLVAGSGSEATPFAVVGESGHEYLVEDVQFRD